MNAWDIFHTELIKANFKEAVAAALLKFQSTGTFRQFARQTPEELVKALAQTESDVRLSPEEATQALELARKVLESLTARTVIRQPMPTETVRMDKTPADEVDPFAVTGQVVHAQSGQPLAGYWVRIYQAKRPREAEYIGASRADQAGNFQIRYRNTGAVRRIHASFTTGGPDLLLKVYDPSGNLVYTSSPLQGDERFKPVNLSLERLNSPVELLDDVIAASGLAKEQAERLRTAGVRQLKDLLDKDAPKRLDGLADADRRRLLAIGKWTGLTRNAALAEKLVEAGYTSVARAARASAARIESRLARQGKALDDRERLALHAARRATGAYHNAIVDSAIGDIRNGSRDAAWPPDSAVGGIRPDPTPTDDPAQCESCDYCQSIFSPLAYLVDLLAFVEANWPDLTPARLKDVFLQDIELDCETALEPIRQIVLAIDVLEKYVMAQSGAAAVNSGWQQTYRETARELLALSGLDPDDPNPGAQVSGLYQLASTTSPKLNTLLSLVEGARQHKSQQIDSAIGEPDEPPDTAGDEAYAAYLSAQILAEAEGLAQRQAFEQQLAALFEPALAAYRQSLLETTDLGAETAQVLENSLFIDLQSAACHWTTRVTQLIQSLQSLILAIRSGEIRLAQRGGSLQNLFDGLDASGFDEQSWEWLRTYAAWNAAIYVLVYPENLLSPPTYRLQMTRFFLDAVSALSTGRATRGSVDAIETQYADYFLSLQKLSVIEAHVVGDRLYLFAHNPAPGVSRLWMNSIPTTALSNPPADAFEADEVPVDAGGWFEVHAWPEDMTPLQVQVYGDGPGLGFIVLGWDGQSYGTFRVRPDGVLNGEATFESEFDSALPGVERVTVANSLLGMTAKFNMDPTPALWAREFTDDYDPVYYSAEFDEGTGNWGAWNIYGQVGASPWFARIFWYGVRDSCIVNRHPCTGWRQDALNVAIRSRGVIIDYQNQSDLGSTTRSLSSPEGGYIWLAWNRDDDETYIVLTEPDGDIYVKRTSVRGQPGALEGSQQRVSVKVYRFAEKKIWPVSTSYNQPWSIDASLDPRSGEAEHICFRERYLYFPLLAAWALNRSGDYISAHDWYRRLYDPFAAPRQRFPFDETFQGGFDRPADWLSGLTDPDAIARRRSGVYLRHTILMMVKNLIDWADHEFALNNPESLNRARELYQMAARVLQAPELKDACQEAIQTLSAYTLPAAYTGASMQAVRETLLGRAARRLRQSRNLETLREATANVKALAAEESSLRRFHQQLDAVVTDAVEGQTSRQAHGTSLVEVYRRAETGREERETGFVFEWIETDLGFLGDYWGTDRGETDVSVGEAVFADFCAPPNPLLEAFAIKITLRLTLLRNCLDVNGEPNPQAVTPLGNLQGRVITTLGQLTTFSAGVFTDPPRYRYSFLIEKAHQYASLAQQLGATLLAAIEKRDSAALALLQAEMAEEVAAATVTLKQYAQAEALQGAMVAFTQRDLAESEMKFWNDRIDQGMMLGLNTAEMSGLALLGASGSLQLMAAVSQFALAGPAMLVTGTGTMLSTASGLAGLVTSETGVGAAAGGIGVAAGVVGAMAGLVAGADRIIGGIQSLAGAAGTFGNLSLTLGSFERRWEEWLHQETSAQFGFRLALDQLELAQDRVQISRQDQAIAELQHGHAQLVIDFLKGRFSNEQLYQWMIGVLLDAYREVMQSATATARLAQYALEFERQQAITEIQGDYWSINEAALTEAQRSSGLLGAERLLADMTRLDAWKIRTDKRRLQIGKTISLAQALPADFVRFRQTGKISFNTLMEWFDRDFPGHYLRLIKSVRLTVAALVPPIDGIHATLSNNGFSTVIVQDEDGRFVEMPARQRFPESVALDSPFNDAGLFVLDYSDPMFLPFEGLGAATGWTLELPQAANRFNYNTLVDVMLTIEYTALHSSTYREQVIQRLGTHQRSDTAISLRSNYPDEWYHLLNPADPAQEQTLIVSLPAHLFPQSISGQVGIRHLMVLLVGEAGKNRPADPVSPADVVFRKEGISSAFEVRTDADGMFSTRTNSPLDADGFPQTPFALDPNDPTALLAPGTLTADTPITLLDPTGEWELVFKASWFVGDSGQRDIDRLSDIVIIMTVEYDVLW